MDIEPSVENIFISPGQLTRSSTCLHAFALDCFGPRDQKRAESDSEKLLHAEEDKFEQMVMEEICADLLPDMSFENALKDRELTLNLMQSGISWIAEGLFFERGLRGRLDLLKKVEHPSLLGEFSYVPVLIRSRKAATFYDSLQLYFFAVLLEAVQGYRPAYGLVYLLEDQVTTVTFTEKLARQFQDILYKMNKVAAGDLKTESMRCSVCSRCLWLPHCSSQWKDQNHISLLSGISASMVRKLAEHEITNCRDMAEQTPEKIHEILDISLKQCQRFIWAAQSRVSGEPLMLRRPKFPHGKPIYFYDIETFEDKVFCHGIIRSHEGNLEEKCFFSETLDEEEKHWHAFLDYLAQDEDAIVYCWTLYEKTFVDILWKRYGGNEQGYGLLRRALVDQCAFVRDHFALPCRGYSIKVVAPFFDFKWQSANANGMNCVAWYYEWMQGREADVRDRIIQYNLDDVRAMEVIDRKLRDWIKQR